VKEAESYDPANESHENVRILVGWLLDIVLRGGKGEHELDVPMACHAAKRFLGRPDQ